MKVTASSDDERFRGGAEKYAAYLKTPEGQLRLNLALANLQDFLPQNTHHLHALDIGGGTGATAVHLARLGFHVTLLDSSLPMLDLAERAAAEAGVEAKIALKAGEATQLEMLFHMESFDVIICHNLLEYVDDPSAVLRRAALLLRREPSSIISVLVRNRAGEVLKAAIKDGDLRQAENNLTVEWALESLYGGNVRLFGREDLCAMVEAASLTVIAYRGVRSISDYLPSKVARDDQYHRIFDLERKLGSRLEFAAIARYTQVLAHRTDLVKKDSA